MVITKEDAAKMLDVVKAFVNGVQLYKATENGNELLSKNFLVLDDDFKNIAIMRKIHGRNRRNAMDYHFETLADASRFSRLKEKTVLRLIESRCFYDDWTFSYEE